MLSFKALILPLSILFTPTVFAQAPQSQEAQKQVFMYVQQMPAPSVDMNAYIAKNMHYPKDAQKEGVEGRVIIQFVVTSEGAVTDCKVVRSLYPSIDSEAIHLLKSMPPWKPGKQNGRAVDVSYTSPFTFLLPH